MASEGIIISPISPSTSLILPYGVILLSRTCALWNRNRFVTYGLLIALVGLTVGAAIVIVRFLNAMRCKSAVSLIKQSLVYVTVNSSPPGSRGCLADGGDPIIFMIFIGILLFECGTSSTLIVIVSRVDSLSTFISYCRSHCDPFHTPMWDLPHCVVYIYNSRTAGRQSHSLLSSALYRDGSSPNCVEVKFQCNATFIGLLFFIYLCGQRGFRWRERRYLTINQVYLSSMLFSSLLPR